MGMHFNIMTGPAHFLPRPTKVIACIQKQARNRTNVGNKSHSITLNTI